MLKLLTKILPDSEIVVRCASAPSKRVVLLLGFGGGSKRFLESFSAFHNERGDSTVAFTMPLAVPGFVRQRLETELAKSVEETRLASGPDTQVCVHSFSNNGAWVLGSLVKRRLLKVDKLIMDSAPSFWYEPLPVLAEARVYGSIVTSVLCSSRGKPPVYFKPLVTPLFYIPLLLSAVVTRLCGLAQMLLFPAAYKQFLVYDTVGLNIYLRDHLPICPTLFLYSTGDSLVTATEVREFIRIQRVRRAELRASDAVVEEEVFESNSIYHVGLWRGARDQYKKALVSFLRD
jgi:hypothetical protein